MKKELIREVMMGMFKQKYDDGLGNRLAAFDCLASVLDTCVETVDPSVFVEHLALGLGDETAVAIPCQAILRKSMDLFTAAVTAGVAPICDAFTKRLKTKVAVGDKYGLEVVQEFERFCDGIPRLVAQLFLMDPDSASIELKELVDLITADKFPSVTGQKEKFDNAMAELQS